jgi:hypothetical protein
MELSKEEQERIEQALRDVADIKSAMDRADQTRRFSRASTPSKLHLMIQLVLGVLALALFILEFDYRTSATEILYWTYHLEWLRWLCIGCIALILLGLLGIFYLAIERAAQREGESFASYVSRNFTYLQNLSFTSDLFLKFVAIAAVMLARRPDWVASLLLMFTGDYLIQGKLFILPIRTALVLGVLFIISGVVQMFFFHGELAYPLFAFFVACALSSLHIMKLQNVESAGE